MAHRYDSLKSRRYVAGHNRLFPNYAVQKFSNAQVQKLGQFGQRVPFSRFRSLLVPLDGTLAAEQALPHALAIASSARAAIRLVHVHSLLHSVNPWEQYDSVKLTERLMQQKQAYLQSVVRRINERMEVDAPTIVIESNEIAQSLCDAAAGATLVVMATHKRSVMGRLLHGSVSETLMRTLRCPLLLVRNSGSVTNFSEGPMPRHILVPLDGTEFAEHVIDAAIAIGSLSDARLTLAHLQHVDEAELWADRSGARHYLQDAAMRLKQRVPHVNTEFVITDRRTAPALLSLIKEKGIDLVALTTHGRHGLARLMKGNVAASLARKAEASVMVLCPSDSLYFTAPRLNRIYC